MSEEQRVCIFSSHHDDTDPRVFHKEAVALSDRGYSVTYFTPFGESRMSDGVEIRNPLPVDRASFEVLPGVFERIVTALLISYYVFQTGDEYDIFHFHDPELLPFSVIHKKLSDKVFIYDVHEDVEKTLQHRNLFSERVRQTLSSIVGTLEHLCAATMDGLIFASDDLYERFKSHDNSITVTNYPPKEWAQLDVPTQDHTDVDVVYCGLLSKQRGILTLIDAMDYIDEESDITLVLGGRYESEEFKNELIQRCGNSQNIELRGWFPTIEGMIRAFYESDIGIMYFHESAEYLKDGAHRSNKLFQYMCAGIPIIVPNLGNWPDVIHQAECGVSLQPERPEKLADTICELAENPSTRDKMGRNGMNAVMSEYNWENEEEKLIRFYHSLLGDE